MSASGKNDDIIITHDLLDIERNNNNNKNFFYANTVKQESNEEKEKIYRNHKS